MAASYSEKTDSVGRVRIELLSHSPVALWTGVLAVPLLMFESKDFSLKNAIVISTIMLVIFGFFYFYTRKTMRLQINPVARTFGVVDGASSHVVKIDDVALARIDQRQFDLRNRWDKLTKERGPDDYLYRVELLLRSGRIVPLISGHGKFNLGDCQRFVTRIETAVRTGK